MNFKMLDHLIYKIPCQDSNGLYGYQVIPYFSSLTQKSYSHLLPFGSLHLSPSSTSFGSMCWLYVVIGWFSQNGYEILLQVFPHLLKIHKRVISRHPQHTLSLEPSNDAKLLLQKVFCWGIQCCYEDTTRNVDAHISSKCSQNLI